MRLTNKHAIVGSVVSRLKRILLQIYIKFVIQTAKLPNISKIVKSHNKKKNKKIIQPNKMKIRIMLGTVDYYYRLL